METRQAKRFKPNLFDLLVILAILVAGVAAYLVLHTSNDTLVVETRTTHYILEVTGLAEGTEDFVAVGDLVQSPSTGASLGTVISVETAAYTKEYMDLSTATVTFCEVPGYINLYLTVEVEVVDGTSTISTTGGTDIRTGTSLSATAGSILASGTIVWVEREDAE